MFDDRIVKIETYTYNLYATLHLNTSGSVHITVYTYARVFSTLKENFRRRSRRKSPNNQDSNNCVAFMFDEIRDELDGVEINRSRNVGTASTIKNFVLTASKSTTLENAEWDSRLSIFNVPTPNDFNFCIPLNVLL